jgi:cell division protein FtsZ
MLNHMKIFSVDPMDPEEDVTIQETTSPAIIKVIGTGSGGTNALNHMINKGLLGVAFIAVNTDKQHLDEISEAEIKLHIGNKHTGGRGAGGDPLKGEDAAKEDREAIIENVRGSDMVFITTGMGGGTGTGSIPVIAKIAKEHGSLVVGVVTTPFKVEGDEKMAIAEKGIEKLREEVDTLIVIPNENLFKIIDSKTSVRQALRYADDILYLAVKGISDLITKTGLINTDFADVESTMKGQGDAHLGIGIGSGDNRAIDAANNAIDNPLLEDVNIDGATRILINIAGPEEFPMMEVREILNTVRSKVGAGAKLKFGITFDPDMGEDVKVTVIATGFQNKRAVPVQEEEVPRKTDVKDIVIDYKRFDEMRGGLRDKRNDSYVGIMRSKDYNDNLEVPTAIRKYNPEADSDSFGKIASNGKDA